eukprot:CAMPEP_0184391460 /NCGR_PEP_ID=MMETSP0007-20130409/14119_1 /TAXON_ID=97485 /ORGANISM="Prymnesium parvum, Strain Texoma1" /LENGTH=80 /DNA_ID=CAMNT_0026741585 /DNA_START=152 /DNA_END=391 /DNA_ORIENTATION=+
MQHEFQQPMHIPLTNKGGKTYTTPPTYLEILWLLPTLAYQQAKRLTRNGALDASPHAAIPPARAAQSSAASSSTGEVAVT